jgi:hypothetical protein
MRSLELEPYPLNVVTVTSMWWSWNKKRIFCFLKSEWDEMRRQENGKFVSALVSQRNQRWLVSNRTVSEGSRKSMSQIT